MAEGDGEKKDRDDDGEADPDGEGEGDFEGEDDRDGSAEEAEMVGESVGDGDAERVADGDGEGDGEVVRDGDGEGDGEVVGEGDGEGDVVPDDGSTWQLVSVVVTAVVVAAVVVTGRSEPARAMLDQTASMPSIRNPPASRLSVVARACPKRIEIALSALLVAVTFRSPGIRTQLRNGLVRSSHIRELSHLCVSGAPSVLSVPDS